MSSIDVSDMGAEIVEKSGVDQILSQLDHFSEEELRKFNFTSFPEIECFFNFTNSHYPAAIDYNDETSGVEDKSHGFSAFCNSTWDGILCWPTTRARSTSILPCISRLNGIDYDIKQNATRICSANGTWANYSDYSECVPLQSGSTNTDVGMSDYTTTIYFFGYAISIVALALAICVFARFKDLRCLRNTIHTHLLITYIMADLLWIVTAILHQLYRDETNKGSCIIVIFLHYFHLTNFFWMFVEGLYLYMLVVETFSADKIKLRVYALIGWGFPLPVVIVWAGVKANWFFTASENSSHTMDLESSCPWMVANSYDWIYITPAIIVLFVNILFLFRIMWVLITKLRSANSLETQQYRKGSKALLVLIPLLGITYVLVITGPTETGILSDIFYFIRAVLLSTQGLSVSIFYCFINTEVQNTIRHHLQRRRINRSLDAMHRRGQRNSNDHGTLSPYTNPHAKASENTRLYQSSIQDRPAKSEISVSELTTVTTFPTGTTAIHLNHLPGTNGHSGLISTRLSNGSALVTSVNLFSEDSDNLLTKENQV